MANAIVDAGTDAKIVKLRRSGMEFIDLAVLEPVEVWAEKPRFAKAGSPSVTPEPTSTPTASTASLSSGSLAQHTPTAPRAQLPQQHHLAPPQLRDPTLSKKGVAGEKRNIFGKMFKKGKDATPPVSPALSANFNIKYPTPTTQEFDSTPTPGRTTGRGHTRNLSASLSPMSSRNRSSSPNPLAKFGLLVPGQEEGNASTSDLSVGGDDKSLLPPVLGIQPTLSYCYVSSGTAGAPGPPQVPQTSKVPRALMHVWFVKKWLKRRADSQDTGGLLGVMQIAASRRGSVLSTSSTASLGPLEEGVEVRFEWKRATSKSKTRGKGKERARGKEEERRGREDADSSESVKASRRFSTISHQSASTNFSASEDGGEKSRPGTPARERKRDRGGPSSSPSRNKDPGLEYDEDSDPEDSETPWVCTLKVRRTGVGAGSRDERDYCASTNGSARASRRKKGAGAMETGQYGDEYDEQGALPPLPEPQVLRIKVGTLSPTPHHPKIVGMLKVPFPLPDLEVERIGISRRPSGEAFYLFWYKCSKNSCSFMFMKDIDLLRHNGKVRRSLREKSRMWCAVLGSGWS